VPLPFLGWRTDRCTCGKKFRGKNRRAAYELHYRRTHEREHESFALMEVDRAEAKRIYDEVNADHVGATANRAESGLGDAG
jgi:hypothetical protein